jgi:hypothetical protein
MNKQYSSRFVALYVLVGVTVCGAIAWGETNPERVALLQMLSGYHDETTRAHLDERFGERAPVLLMSVVAAKNDDSISAYNQRRALTLLGAYDCVQVPQIQPFLIGQVTDQRNTAQWKQLALTVLGKACKERAVETLTPYLSHSDPWLRSGASKGLEHTGSSSTRFLP